MCGAWIALWAGAWIWWRTTTFRPGCAILVNFPNCSINVTVPVFTWLGFKSGVVSADGRAVTQGMIPHDMSLECLCSSFPGGKKDQVCCERRSGSRQFRRKNKCERATVGSAIA
eukprot:scaffold23655_cov65-Phaeocystis_antarctica.AAC.15